MEDDDNNNNNNMSLNVHMGFLRGVQDKRFRAMDSRNISFVQKRAGITDARLEQFSFFISNHLGMTVSTYTYAIRYKTDLLARLKR